MERLKKRFLEGGQTIDFLLFNRKHLQVKKTKLHIHPEKKIRVWYDEKFIEELLW